MEYLKNKRKAVQPAQRTSGVVLLFGGVFTIFFLNAHIVNAETKNRKVAINLGSPIGYAGYLSDWGDGYADSGEVPVSVGFAAGIEYVGLRYFTFGVSAQGDALYYRSEPEQEDISYYSMPIFVPLTLRGVMPISKISSEVYIQSEIGFSVLKDSDDEYLKGVGISNYLGFRYWATQHVGLFVQTGVSLRFQDDNDHRQEGKSQSLLLPTTVIGCSVGF